MAQARASNARVPIVAAARVRAKPYRFQGGSAERAQADAFRQQREVQQPVGVVVGRPQHLPAGQVLVNCRDAALQSHIFCRQWFADRQARQSGTVGAQQENGLDQIAARDKDIEAWAYLDPARTRWLDGDGAPMNWSLQQNPVVALEIDGKVQVRLDRQRATTEGGD